MASPDPIIVLVKTQLGENIGTSARAMLNCGLKRMRLVSPKAEWPNSRAVAAASRADEVLEGVECFGTVREAVADCTRVFATTARSRSRQLPAMEVTGAVCEIRANEGQTAILFGPEASGLDNDMLSHADTLMDFPVNPDFSSLNLAQAVLLFGWEWQRGSNVVERTTEPAASKAEFSAFMDRLERKLEKNNFFPSEDLRPETVRNLRALFGRITPTERELRMLHGVVTALGGKDIE